MKLGSLHWWDLDEGRGGNDGGHNARLTMGMQKRFTDNFSMVFEASGHAPEIVPSGKFGFVWAF